MAVQNRCAAPPDSLSHACPPSRQARRLENKMVLEGRARRWRTELDPRTLRLFIGAVAQLGERSVRNAEVVGSTPIGSTNGGGRLHQPPPDTMPSVELPRSSGRATVDVPSTVGGAGQGRDVSRFAGSAREIRAPAVVAQPSSRLAGSGHAAATVRAKRTWLRKPPIGRPKARRVGRDVLVQVGQNGLQGPI